MVRRTALALLFFAIACTTTTSVTRTGTGLFAPRVDAEEEEPEEAPRGLDLSVASVAPDGTVILDLRNYSLEPFVFSGTPDRPRLLLEVRSDGSYSRSTLSPSLRRQTHEVPAGERIQLKTNVGGISGRLRLGIASQQFGYVVWTSWIVR